MSSEIISNQVKLPWGKAVELAIKSLKKRLVRSTITMASVVLAIAFLMNILTNNGIVDSLRAMQSPVINDLLMKNGVDLAAVGMSSKTIWLVVMSLLVCSVGIVNAMLMSVTERFQEIGTMKCLGAMDGFIIKIFMIEAFIQGSFGTLLGIIIGLVISVALSFLTYGAAVFTEFPVVGIAISAILSFVIGVGLCTIFAIYPAYHASTMQPVDAMRVEE